MDNILNYLSGIFNNKEERVVQVNVDKVIKNIPNSGVVENNYEQTEAINLSNLNYDQTKEILKINKKLFNMYLQFGLYRNLSKEDVKKFLKDFKIPYPHIEEILQFIIEIADKNLLEIFVNKNSELFTEKEILDVLNYLLNSENEADLNISILTVILQIEIDKDYFLTQIKRNSKLEFNSKSLTNFVYILCIVYERENKINLLNYFSLVSDLLLAYYFQGKIENNLFQTLTNDLEKIKNKIKNETITKHSYYIPNERIIKFHHSCIKDDFIIEKLKI